MRVLFVIPTKNSGGIIKRCLDSIFSQKTNVEFEVIIVDKNSDDDTDSILKDYRVKVLKCTGTVGEARRVGVEVAKGNFVAFIDSDVYIENNWLEEMLNKADEKHGTIGKVDFKRNLFGRYLSLGYLFSRKESSELKRPIPTLNTMIYRKAILDAGNFDDKLVSSEDGDLTYRMVKLGHSFFYVSSARCFHDIGLSPSSVYRNDLWLMKGFLACVRKHGVKTMFFKEVLGASVSLFGLILLTTLLFLNMGALITSLALGILFLLIYSSFRFKLDVKTTLFTYLPVFIFKRISMKVMKHM